MTERVCSVAQKVTYAFTKDSFKIEFSTTMGLLDMLMNYYSAKASVGNSRLAHQLLLLYTLMVGTRQWKISSPGALSHSKLQLSNAQPPHANALTPTLSRLELATEPQVEQRG